MFCNQALGIIAVQVKNAQKWAPQIGISKLKYLK